MPTSIFELDESHLAGEIRKRKARLVFLQLPEGLKAHGPKLAAIVEEAGATAIISADPCYGACDLASVEARSVGADLIVHYGHSEMQSRSALPTLYIEAKAKTTVKSAVKKAVPLLETWRNIGLVTTVQHVHKLDEAKTVLLEAGKAVAVGDAGRLKHAGQVVGCDYSNAKAVSREVDAFLFVGGGKFHPMGAVLATGKPTVVADPYEKRAFRIEIETSKLLRKRWANIQETKLADEIGILVGLKPGQKRIDQALKMKNLVEDAGKKAILLAIREITPEALMQFPTIDAFINTTCPRLSLDDAGRFRSPLLTPKEALVALGKIQWEKLCKEGWFEN